MPTYVCKLRKALYGLKQAPRAWFEKLKSAFIAWGFSNSFSDTSLFFTHKGGRPLFLLVYVNDILITGEDSNAIQQLIKDLNIQFSLKTLGPVNYFLGFEVIRSPSSLHLSKTKYAIDFLNKTKLLHAIKLSLLYVCDFHTVPP